MRLGLKLLNTSATLNQYKHVNSVRLARGETVDIFFQLVDLDQGGLRYVPTSGATLQVVVPRSDEVLALPQNQRELVNNTIDRAASAAFAGDGSIFKLPLLAADTAKMVSSSLRVTLTEGPNVKIAFLNQAIQIMDGQDS